MSPDEILNLKMDIDMNDAGASSIREYLKELLFVLWDEREGFSGKRPFGNSGWEFDLYVPLIESGVVEGTLDLDGYVQHVNKEQADTIIYNCIHAL